MPMFRKKPVVIEARELTETNQPDIEAWIHAGKHSARHQGRDVLIQTLEGVMTASPGDWIICGVKGEFYPCAPDIFAATYETA